MEQLSLEIQAAWGQFVDYLPQLLAAIALILVAWLVASIIGYLVRQAVKATKADKSPGSDEKTKTGLGKSLGAAAFWLTILLFLPPIIRLLGLTETLGPVQNLVDGILTYTPRIIGAILILAVGWVVATIASRAISSLIAAAPIDTFASRTGFGDVVNGAALAKALGVIVFTLIFIPVIIGALETLALSSITYPATRMLEDLLIAIPEIIGAMLILLLAFFIARAVKSFLLSVLPAFGIDKVFAELGFASSGAAIDNVDDATQRPDAAPGKVSASAILANIAMLAILLFGILEAVELLGLASITVLLSELIIVAGRILLGAIIIIVGIYIARFVAGLIRKSGSDHAGLIATITQYGIIILITAMGLREMGLGEDILLVGFTLILAAAALAAALAFGIGGRDTAHKVLEDLRQKDGPPRS